MEGPNLMTSVFLFVGFSLRSEIEFIGVQMVGTVQPWSGTKTPHAMLRGGKKKILW